MRGGGLGGGWLEDKVVLVESETFFCDNDYSYEYYGNI